MFEKASGFNTPIPKNNYHGSFLKSLCELGTKMSITFIWSITECWDCSNHATSILLKGWSMSWHLCLLQCSRTMEKCGLQQPNLTHSSAISKSIPAWYVCWSGTSCLDSETMRLANFSNEISMSSSPLETKRNNPAVMLWKTKRLATSLPFNNRKSGPKWSDSLVRRFLRLCCSPPWDNYTLYTYMLNLVSTGRRSLWIFL